MTPTKEQLDRWQQFTTALPCGIVTVDLLSEAEAKDALCAAMEFIEQLDALQRTAAEHIATWRQ